MKSNKISKNQLILRIIGLIFFWVGAITLVVGFLLMNVNFIMVGVGIGLMVVGLLAMRSPEAWKNWLVTWLGF